MGFDPQPYHQGLSPRDPLWSTQGLLGDLASSWGFQMFWLSSCAKESWFLMYTYTNILKIDEHGKACGSCRPLSTEFCLGVKALWSWPCRASMGFLIAHHVPTVRYLVSLWSIVKCIHKNMRNNEPEKEFLAVAPSRMKTKVVIFKQRCWSF